ncbi:MAG: hypothetical protein HGA37_04010 [Lentimicrobium sp.]|nr:hypothetical protein [Lentimicrobium sp.]
MSNHLEIKGMVPEISNRIQLENVFATQQLKLFWTFFSDATIVASLIRYPVVKCQ